ncbi:DUF928 domain-containing protein [Pedobacter hiemivivus]|uniref:DUF928 domain-containing protein n=1 Tax=Pedobacter hiemivivus TaxID=2530454 RepID=A0A4U1FYW9_9SPHI|nr:DUF928 domain-containing protein [Pedobacter hiemivivus]TKC55290.1 DUF928 domain-containing protein [Pedobacter hiemivivus]
MLNKVLIFIVFIAFSCSVSAQVSVHFIPEVYGRSLDGLMNASIMNAAEKRNVRLLVTVTEEKGGKILRIMTPPFTIVPGNNGIPPAAVRSANVQMGNGDMAGFIQRNGYFPQGNYEYNYAVVSAVAIEEVIVEQIFEQEVLPPAPLDLIEPFNEDKICNRQPLLTWQPSMPNIIGTMYELLMVEIKDRQSPVEALNYNLPIVKQKGIMTPMLLYPPSSKDLIEGKRYAWQVTAYKGQTIINRSEVWEFKLDCKEEEEPAEDDNGYRDIDDLFKGNFYIAHGVVKFALVNSYDEQPLKYTITCITDPKQKTRSLPKVKLKKGKNKINIDLSNNFSFKDGYSYILKASLPNGMSKSLRFIFKDI